MGWHTSSTLFFLALVVVSECELRRIRIGTGPAPPPPPEPQPWTASYPSVLFWPPPPPSQPASTWPMDSSPQIPSHPVFTFGRAWSPQEEQSPFELPSTTPRPPPPTTTSATRRIFLRKIAVRPRGGKPLKNTYQNLTPVNLQTTTETYITMAPIGEPAPAFNHDKIMDMCTNAYKMASNFGVHNFDRHYAGANCGYIRMFYPDATCKDIETFMTYCDKHRVRAA